MSKAETQSDDSDVPETYEKLQELTCGDCVTINNTDYYVVIQNTGIRSLIMPDFPTLIQPDGTTKDLAFGTVPNSDECGVIWSDDIGTDEPTADDLLAEYDQVTITEHEPQTAYSRLETTTDKQCPHCGNTTARFRDGHKDGQTTTELLTCNDSDDCGEFYIRQRELPVDDSATATVQTFDGETKEIELNGCFRETITSRFKLDPRRNAEECWMTATEVAEVLEAKTTGESTHGAIKENWNGNIVWKDSQYDYKIEIEYRPVRFE